MTYRDDKDALLARADALARQLDEAKRALSDKDQELERLRAGKSDVGTETKPRKKVSTKASVPKDVQAIETRRAKRASTNPLLRILSVFSRGWVIIFFWLPSPFLIGSIFLTRNAAPQYLPFAIAGVVVWTLGIVLIEAYLRRCKTCRKLLAGAILSRTRDKYEHHIGWMCVFCKHRWRTSSFRRN